MKKNVLLIIISGICFLTLLCLAACTDKTDSSDEKKNEIEVENASLVFDSVEELIQVKKNYPKSIDNAYIGDYNLNKFEELVIDYYPLTPDGYKLKNIEVNPYNVFYYYVKIGEKAPDYTFDYSSGIVVTFPREKEATMENVKKQFSNSFIEYEDGSVFLPKTRSLHIPLGTTYYCIDFPESASDFNKEIIKIVKNDQ